MNTRNVTSTCDTSDAEARLAFLETIALLEEEIARLEGELRQRDDATADRDRLEPAALAEEGAAADPRLGDLAAELARRDETIVLLWQQIQELEEAEAAKQAEWDQLHQWMSEVERRVDGRDQAERDVEHELAAQRLEAQSLRHAIEAERKTWQAQQRTFEEEVSSLRARAAERPSSADAGPSLRALQEENERLRDTARELAAAAAAADETASLRERLRAASAVFDQARAELRVALDDSQRQRNEHQAELASLRTQLARESTPPGSPELSTDDRLEAFRQHLREMQVEEDAKRVGRQFATRLARLWRHTGPKR